MRQPSLSRQRVATIAHAIDTRSMAIRITGIILALALLIGWFPAKAFSADSPNMQIAKAISGALAEVVEQVSPAVVGIETERVAKTENFSGD